MNSTNRELRQWLAPAVVLAGLVILAFALRFCRLGEWNFQATEIFTLRDSVRPQFHNPRPLGYLFNYYLVRPFRPLDELGLRLFPALFGALAIPAFYFVTRRLIGTRAALLGTLLLTVSPLLISYSQLARYWSLVFLLCTIYPYAIYLGIREGNRQALAIGLVTGVLAVLAHPVSILLVGGPGIWLLVTYLRPRYLREWWQRRGFRWGMGVALVLAGAVVMRLVPILQGWITQHDKAPGVGQFLLRTATAPGARQVSYLLAYAESLTLPLTLSAVVGIYLIWRERDRALGVFLTCLALFPIAFLTLISLRTAVSTYYLLPTAPVFFIGAGVFLDRLFEVDWKIRPQWLFPVAVTLIVISAGVPTLISDYRNGRRYDFRGVAHWLEGRLQPGDVVFSDQPMVLAHYLQGRKVEHLRYDVAPLEQAVRATRQSGRGEALWIVAPGLSHAFRTNLKQGGLIGWIYENCQLRSAVGRGRVDFRQQYLQVYRCPPAPAPSADEG